jgi:MFS family permease
MIPGEPTRAGDQRGGWRALRRLTLDLTSLRASRDWRLLFLSQDINVLGDQIRIVAVPFLVYTVTHSSFMVGLVSLVQFVPTLLLVLGAGTVADRVDRKRVLLGAQVLYALSCALLAASILTGRAPLWLIFLIVAAAAGFQSLEGPARKAAIPRLVVRDQLANAMALDQVTYGLGSVIGPVGGGLLIAHIGVGRALLLNLAAATITLAMLAFVRPMPPDAEGQASSSPGIGAILEGLSHVRRSPAIFSTFLIDLSAMFFGGPMALMPALAQQVFRVGPVGLGLLYAAPGAGAFLGSLVTGWVGRVRHQGAAVVVAVCIWGASISLFGLVSRPFWLALLLLAAGGAADMYSAIFRGTILLMGTPDRLRGRLSAVHFLVVTSGPRLGDMEAGSVAAVLGTRFAVVSGGLGAIAGAIILALAVPVFLQYDAHAAQEPPEARMKAGRA